MKKIEYKIVNSVTGNSTELEAELNKLGADGWDAVHIEKIAYNQYSSLFKRESK